MKILITEVKNASSVLLSQEQAAKEAAASAAKKAYEAKFYNCSGDVEGARKLAAEAAAIAAQTRKVRVLVFDLVVCFIFCVLFTWKNNNLYARFMA